MLFARILRRLERAGRAVQCEHTVAHLLQCCGKLPVERVCDDETGCDSNVDPVFSIAESEQLQERACSAFSKAECEEIAERMLEHVGANSYGY